MNLKKIINKYLVWIILASVFLVILGLVKSPVFFDNFGIIVFAYIFYLGVYLSKKNVPDFVIYSLLIIGTSGWVIDFVNILKV